MTTLKENWEKIKNENPKVRIREAAKQLGVSEAALVNTAVGVSNIRLNNQFQELLKEVENLAIRDWR